MSPPLLASVSVLRAQSVSLSISDGAPLLASASALHGPTLTVGDVGVAEERRPAGGPERRRRRDHEATQAYWARRQRDALEEQERKRLEALAEAERALEEAETAKKAEAKRAAVRKVFEAIKRAGVTEATHAAAHEAEQAALAAIAKRQTVEQRRAYLDALDQLNAEIEAIGAEIARLYARRRQEEEVMLLQWFSS